MVMRENQKHLRKRVEAANVRRRENKRRNMKESGIAK